MLESSTATCTSAGVASARALRTRRSNPTASAATARSARCSSGPRRSRASSGCTTLGTPPRRCSLRPASISTRSREILRHSDPKITFETYAHLVPGYLQEQIDRLPKLEKFAALVLQEPQTPENERRRQLPESSESRRVGKARLAGVEPAARGFEGRCSIQLSYRRVARSCADGRSPRQGVSSVAHAPGGGSAGRATARGGAPRGSPQDVPGVELPHPHLRVSHANGCRTGV